MQYQVYDLPSQTEWMALFNIKENRGKCGIHFCMSAYFIHQQGFLGLHHSPLALLKCLCPSHFFPNGPSKRYMTQPRLSSHVLKVYSCLMLRHVLRCYGNFGWSKSITNCHMIQFIQSWSSIALVQIL